MSAPTGRLAPDATVVRVAAPVVEWVEVGGEVVVWHRDDQALHLLDRPTSLVFLLADGSTTLGGTVDELGAELGSARAELADGVLAAAAELADRHLVTVLA